MLVGRICSSSLLSCVAVDRRRLSALSLCLRSLCCFSLPWGVSCLSCVPSFGRYLTRPFFPSRSVPRGALSLRPVTAVRLRAAV